MLTLSNACSALLTSLIGTLAAPAGERSIEVRSSADIPLPYVEVRDEWGWDRVPVGEDGLVVLNREESDEPTELRAPGHATVTLGTFERNVFFEPDALLEVRRPASGARIRSVRLEGSGRGQDESSRGRPSEDLARGATPDTCFGPVADGLWRIAVRGAAGPIRVRIEYEDGERARIELRPEPGLRASWEPRRAPATAPLSVEVVRPAGTPGPLNVKLRRGALRGGEASVVEERLWGRVWDPLPEPFELVVTELAAGESVLELGELRTGLFYSVSASDKRTRAAGGLGFTHDGAARTLALEPPLTLRGTLVGGSGAPLDGTAQLAWRRRKEDWAPESFQHSNVELQGGTFELFVPRSKYAFHLMPEGAAAFVSFPEDLGAFPLLELAVYAPHHAPASFTFDVGDATAHDCGELALEQAVSTPQLALYAGYPSGDRGRAEVRDLPPPGAVTRLRLHGDRSSAWHVDRVERGAGRLDVFLRGRQGGFTYEHVVRGKPEISWRALPAEPPAAALVVGPENAAFAADEHGDLRRVGSATYDVTVSGALPASAAVLWRSMWLAVDRRDEAEGTVRLRFSGPRHGVFLFWGREARPLRPGKQLVEL